MIEMGNIIHKGKGSFTHVENTIFFDHTLSLKAKGIYCQIRSLENNAEWVFTIRGFATLVKDGVDAVTAGLKELEDAGYIIRARKRSENGRFLKAESAVWITLDDPDMYDSAVEELTRDGFAVLSEFSRGSSCAVETREDASAPEEPEEDENEVTSSQVETRTGFSRSGKTTSGKSGTINYSLDKRLTEINNPSLSPQDAGAVKDEKDKGEEFKAYRKGEFPELFEKLCERSLKPVESLSYKRSCFEIWKRRVEEGYAPLRILEAYESYAKSHWIRNGDDNSYAKNLARWLECESGLEAYADEPIPPDIRGEDGSPLPMDKLAEADPSFAPLWRKVTSRRSVVLSYVLGADQNATRQAAEDAINADEPCKRYLKACEDYYKRYVETCEMLERIHREYSSAYPQSEQMLNQ